MGRNGQLWNGKGGFAYKKSGGAGGRKNPPYGLITGTPQNVWNKYTPGAGVGGLNTSVRRAKMRIATSCNKNQRCGSFYMGLGMNQDIPGVWVAEQPIITSIESGNNSLIVYFTQVNTSPAVVTNYMYSINGSNGPFMQFIPPTTNNPLTIYPLKNGIEYNIAIKALNYAGESATSNVMSGTPMTVPSAPILLTAVPGNSQITLSFICYTGGSPITDILYSINAGATFVSSGTTTSPITISGLTNGVSYTVELIAVNMVGLSQPSVPTTITPVGPPNPPTNLIGTAGNQSAVISFTPGFNGGSQITDYLYSIDGGITFVSSGSTTSPITINGLTNGVTYNIVLEAINSLGQSNASLPVSVTPLGPPNPPTNLIGTAGNQSAVISFTPGFNGGSQITDYLYSIDGGITFVSSGSTTSPITINGLTNGVTYNVQLKAVNSLGQSNASLPVSVTPVNPISAPDAPTNLNGTPENQSAIISFTSGFNGGSPITDYLYSIDGGVTFVSSGSTTSPITINGLTNGITYNIQLKAVNIVGTSPASDSVLVTPNVVETIVQFTSVGPTTWTAPANVTSVEYLVVGGGGGSGGTHDGGAAGGGGGGMVLSGTILVVPGTVYDVIVGDGGAGGIGSSSLPRETNGEAGENSQFFNIIALGGGRGYMSRNNGSGVGGTAPTDISNSSTGGYGGSYNNGGGGGGGSSTNGANGTVGVPRTGGTGGSGTTNNITGTLYTYGAGGAGGNALVANNAIAGAANTGNGAKGPGTTYSSQRSGAKGGSGIVILKYTPSIPDAIVNSLTTSLTAYNDAANGDWVKITSTEYSNLQTNVSGTTKVGISDSYLSSATYSGLTVTDQSAMVANTSTANTPAIPANNYLYAFAVKYGNNIPVPATDLRIFTNTSISSFTGFNQLGSVLPPPDTGLSGFSINYYVIKGNNTANGSTTGLLSLFTGATTKSAVYLGFYQNFSVNNSMRYLLFTPATSGNPNSSSVLSGSIPNYGAFCIQGLATETKQWN